MDGFWPIFIINTNVYKSVDLVIAPPPEHWPTREAKRIENVISEVGLGHGNSPAEDIFSAKCGGECFEERGYRAV